LGWQINSQFAGIQRYAVTAAGTSLDGAGKTQRADLVNAT
jgi:hypothetical protein